MIRPLVIHNSLSNRKEPFVPMEPGRVRMYVCGMTVYDYCHLGHARVMVVFDVVYRYLTGIGYQVDYVRNITDIDDKIINRANEQGQSTDQLTGRFIEAMHQDAAALGVLPPGEEPRATAYIAEIVAMIERLIERGYAYPGANGDVYYAVERFAEYGRLSGKSLQDLIAGARVDVAESKRNPLDFVLWKSAKPGEPSWDSPWGAGRPGWHIECSAMSTCCLGNHFDIHGGGADLQFPHHENEIAQSQGATGETFVNYWMHNGFVRINEEKMSKSLGNFFTVRDILQSYRAEEIRYFMLTAQYRSPLNYDEEHLRQARQSLQRLYNALRDLPVQQAFAESDYSERFHQAMGDDFNTPEALAVLFEMARELNRQKESDAATAGELAAEYRHLAGLLGILQQRPEQYLRGDETAGDLSDEAIEGLIAERRQARAAKDWARADAVRDRLQQAGIILEDAGQETRWRRDLS